LSFDPNRTTTIRITRPNLLEDRLETPFWRSKTLKRAQKLADLAGDEPLAKELKVSPDVAPK
jgi:hypothetical protein